MRPLFDFVTYFFYLHGGRRAVLEVVELELSAASLIHHRDVASYSYIFIYHIIYHHIHIQNMMHQFPSISIIVTYSKGHVANQPADRPTGRVDIHSYRDVRTHLEMENEEESVEL